MRAPRQNAIVLHCLSLFILLCAGVARAPLPTAEHSLSMVVSRLIAYAEVLTDGKTITFADGVQIPYFNELIAETLGASKTADRRLSPSSIGSRARASDPKIPPSGIMPFVTSQLASFEKQEELMKARRLVRATIELRYENEFEELVRNGEVNSASPKMRSAHVLLATRLVHLLLARVCKGRDGGEKPLEEILEHWKPPPPRPVSTTMHSRTQRAGTPTVNATFHSPTVPKLRQTASEVSSYVGYSPEFVAHCRELIAVDGRGGVAHGSLIKKVLELEAKIKSHHIGIDASLPLPETLAIERYLEGDTRANLPITGLEGQGKLPASSPSTSAASPSLTPSIDTFSPRSSSHTASSAISDTADDSVSESERTVAKALEGLLEFLRILTDSELVDLTKMRFNLRSIVRRDAGESVTDWTFLEAALDHQVSYFYSRHGIIQWQKEKIDENTLRPLFYHAAIALFGKAAVLARRAGARLAEYPLEVTTYGEDGELEIGKKIPELQRLEVSIWVKRSMLSYNLRTFYPGQPGIEPGFEFPDELSALEHFPAPIFARAVMTTSGREELKRRLIETIERVSEFGELLTLGDATSIHFLPVSKKTPHQKYISVDGFGDSPPHSPTPSKRVTRMRELVAEAIIAYKLTFNRVVEDHVGDPDIYFSVESVDAHVATSLLQLFLKLVNIVFAAAHQLNLEQDASYGKAMLSLDERRRSGRDGAGVTRRVLALCMRVARHGWTYNQIDKLNEPFPSMAEYLGELRHYLLGAAIARHHFTSPSDVLNVPLLLRQRRIFDSVLELHRFLADDSISRTAERQIKFDFRPEPKEEAPQNLMMVWPTETPVIMEFAVHYVVNYYWSVMYPQLVTKYRKSLQLPKREAEQHATDILYYHMLSRLIKHSMGVYERCESFVEAVRNSRFLSSEEEVKKLKRLRLAVNTKWLEVKKFYERPGVFSHDEQLQSQPHVRYLLEAKAWLMSGESLSLSNLLEEHARVDCPLNL